MCVCCGDDLNLESISKASLFRIKIVISYSDMDAITNAIMLIITADKAEVASYVDGRILKGIQLISILVMYRMASGNNGKNACACSDGASSSTLHDAVVASLLLQV